jgi:hypothetical protein
VAHDVFISYSTEDKPIADAVCNALESRKIRCWIAPRDVPPGANWGAAIIDAIDETKVMVVVFSGHANKSHQVYREIERAVNDGDTIIPFRVEDVMPSKDMEFFISSCHWLDAMSPPMEAHLAQLADCVQSFLGVPLQAGASQLPPAAPVVPRNSWRWAVLAAGALAAVALALLGVRALVKRPEPAPPVAQTPTPSTAGSPVAGSQATEDEDEDGNSGAADQRAQETVRIYAIDAAGQMFAIRPSAPAGSIERGRARRLSDRWNFKQIFAGESGSIYAINDNGEMFFFRLGRSRGAPDDWTVRNQRIGTGWNFKQVFAGDRGAVYAVAANGDLLYYNHAGTLDGSDHWPIQARVIDRGWNYKQVFAGDEGAIYAIAQNGDLFFYRHTGIDDGSDNWSVKRRQIGNGWDFAHVFAGRHGAVYAIRADGVMLYYRHAGWQDGSRDWPVQAKEIGHGWKFSHVFAGRGPRPR